MIGDTNRLDVPEVTAYIREQVDGGCVIRYLIRQPGETAWRAVRLFRPAEPVASEQET
jgi:hypothetical protein